MTLFDTGENKYSSIELKTIRGEIEYKAFQMPIEYFISKNVATQNVALVDSISLNMIDERIMILEFRGLDEGDLLKSDITGKSYEDGVKYLAFDIQSDFHLETSGGRKIKCAGLTFERNFNVAPFKRILLNFSGVPKDEELKLVYNDKLFGNGVIKFNFNERPIKL